MKIGDIVFLLNPGDNKWDWAEKYYHHPIQITKLLRESEVFANDIVEFKDLVLGEEDECHIGFLRPATNIELARYRVKNEF